MNPRAIARWRLRAQGIHDPRFQTPEDVVRWLGAVQSQEYALAKWSVGMRSGADEPALDRALAEGTILRTHVLRPTWHFVLPDDIVWLLDLTGDRVRSAVATYERRLGLDDALLGRAADVIARAVEGGRHLTRAEVKAELARAGIDARTSRLAHILMNVELRGIVCSGAPRARQQTYALVSERAPGARRMPRAEALAELAARYFAGHGPATMRDFRWWSGLRAAEARQAVDALGDALDSFDAGGRTYHHIEAAPSMPTRPLRTAHLLQGYDEYIVAYTDSRDVIDVDSLATNLTPTRPPFTHAVVLDGQVIGHWRQRQRPRSTHIELRHIQALTPATRRAIEAAANRYGTFTGMKTEVV